MDISVILPAYNEEQLLPDTLSSLNQAVGAWEALGWSYEVIVCDNDSTDATARIARELGAKVVHESERRIGSARNRGALEASGRFLVFLDADSLPSSGLLKETAEALQCPEVIGGGSTLRFPEGEHRGRLVMGLWNQISRWKGWAAGSFLFVQADAFREVGGFGEELYAGEEIELSKRLVRLGRQTGREMRILFQHPLTTSPRKLDLYSPWEHLLFMARALFSGGRCLRNRHACSIWYDGRR